MLVSCILVPCIQREAIVQTGNIFVSLEVGVFIFFLVHVEILSTIFPLAVAPCLTLHLKQLLPFILFFMQFLFYFIYCAYIVSSCSAFSGTWLCLACQIKRSD